MPGQLWQVAGQVHITYGHAKKASLPHFAFHLAPLVKVTTGEVFQGYCQQVVQ